MAEHLHGKEGVIGSSPMGGFSDMLRRVSALGYILLGITLGWLARNAYNWIEWKLDKHVER